MNTLIRRLVPAVLLVVLIAAAPAPGQPTFGRPKPGKKKPEAPRQVEPDPDAEVSDIPDPAGPDVPGPKSPMYEPDANRRAFVPSPEEWLDTDPPRAQPAADLTPGATYAWRSADGLRYTYTIPPDYKPGEAYDVVVICHPANNDFRWGLGNHVSMQVAMERGSPRLAFRPGNVVVSVDGVGADAQRPKSRYFTCDGASVVRFRDFMLELTRTLPARRFYLYGAGGGDDGVGGGGGGGGGGGQFVLRFAATFPALADGVIAYGTNAPPGDAKRCHVPTVIMHGVKNGLVSFAEAVKVYDANVQVENKLVRLRALRGFNDYPNPVRVSECIDWLNAVRTDDPAEALAAVESMLTPKTGDEYDYLCPVWYAGAREILGRILGEPGALTGEAPFEGKSAAKGEGAGDEAVKSRADELVRLLDAEAQVHVDALRQWIPEGKAVDDLVLDGQPWLGYLIAARDDFRGVAPMEKFAASLGYDEALAAQKDAAAEFLEEWSSRDDAENFAMAGAVLPRCFLLEHLPVDLPAKMKAWKRKQQSGELELDPEALEAYEFVLNWDEGYRKGLDAYQRAWRKWRFEPGAGNKP